MFKYLKELFTEHPYLTSLALGSFTTINSILFYKLYKNISQQNVLDTFDNIEQLIFSKNYKLSRKLIETFKKTDTNGILSEFLELLLIKNEDLKQNVEIFNVLFNKVPKTMKEIVCISRAYKIVENPQKGFEMLNQLLLSEKNPISHVYFEFASYYFNQLLTQEEAISYLFKATELGNPFAQFEYYKILKEGKYGTTKDAEKSIYYLKLSAKSGYIPAINRLGFCYENGYDVPKDLYHAFLNYQRSANLGDGSGMYDVGYFYATGLGTKLNPILALEWYQKAYENGHVNALIGIGSMYEFGNGVEKNPSKTFEYYKRSAEEGYLPGWNSVAYCYEQGLGIEKSLEKSIEYYRKTASVGHKTGQFNLGRAFHFGLGVVQDYTVAFKYYKMSSDQNLKEASHNLGILYINGLGCEKNLKEGLNSFLNAYNHGYIPSCVQIGYCYYFDELDLENAYKYFEIARNQGIPEGTYWMGRIVEVGFPGLLKNPKLALELYLEAFNGGYAEADVSIGYYYLHGLHGPADYNKSLDYYQLAVERNSPQGYNFLGYHYKHGLGVKKNPVLAFQYFMASFQLGDRSDSCLHLGLALLTGEGVAKDQTSALNYFIEGSKNGNKDCMYNAGISLEKGEGTEIDLPRALEYYTMAYHHGHTLASDAVSVLPFLMNKWTPDEVAKEFKK
jgi:uncharacterized protein